MFAFSLAHHSLRRGASPPTSIPTHLAGPMKTSIGSLDLGALSMDLGVDEGPRLDADNLLGKSGSGDALLRAISPLPRGGSSGSGGGGGGEGVHFPFPCPPLSRGGSGGEVWRGGRFRCCVPWL